VDTSATPGMIFWRKHPKDHQESRSPVNPPPPNADQGRNQTSHSKDDNAGALGWADVIVRSRLVISSFCANGGLVALPMRAPVG
jgi:hypothetical protein